MRDPRLFIRPHSWIATALAVISIGAGELAAQSPPDASDERAWTTLTATRNALAHAPRAIPFEQTFVPAGFNSGDRETGTASFDLPRCARWDYADPDPRSYLLCGDTVWTWNTGEDSGRRLQLDGSESGPFELWLAPLDDLRRRYQAVLTPINDAFVAVRIRPTRSADFDFAEIVVDSDRQLPIRFEYRDFEGSVTSFEFGDGSLLDTAASPFEPPAIEWITEDQ